MRNHFKAVWTEDRLLRAAGVWPFGAFCASIARFGHNYKEMNELSKESVNWLTVGDDAAGQRVDNFLTRDPQGGSEEPHLPDPAQRRGPREQGAGRPRCAAGARGRRARAAGADRGARGRLVRSRPAPARPSRCRSCTRTTRSLSSTSRPDWRSTAAAGSRPGSSSRCARRGRTRASSNSSTGSTATRRARCCSRRSARRSSRCTNSCARRRSTSGTSCWCADAGATRSAASGSRSRSSRRAKASGACAWRTTARRTRRRSSAACGVWPDHDPPLALLEAELLTGRTHQIRVHLAHLGFPLAGDDKYGDFAWNKALAKEGLKRMFLHARQLTFTHPADRRADDARGAAARRTSPRSSSSLGRRDGGARACLTRAARRFRLHRVRLGRHAVRFDGDHRRRDPGRVPRPGRAGPGRRHGALRDRARTRPMRCGVVAPGLPAHRYGEMTAHYRRHYLAREDNIPLFAGADRMLADLDAAGYLLAVATGKSRAGLDRVLAQNALDDALPRDALRGRGVSEAASGHAAAPHGAARRRARADADDRRHDARPRTRAQCRHRGAWRSRTARTGPRDWRDWHRSRPCIRSRSSRRGSRRTGEFGV